MTIKDVREKNKLSQTAFAKSIGVSASTVAAIESGRMNVSSKVADAVKAAYGEVIEVSSKIEKKSEKVEKKAGTAQAKANTTKEKAETKAAKAS